MHYFLECATIPTMKSNPKRFIQEQMLEQETNAIQISKKIGCAPNSIYKMQDNVRFLIVERALNELGYDIAFVPRANKNLEL